MEPIVNFCSQTVSWIGGAVVFSTEGLPVAFIRRGSVFAAKDCARLGQFDDGVFRDRLGCIVASFPGKWWSRGCPTPHGMLRPPSVQFFQMPDCAGLPTAPCRLTEPLLSRSTLNWECFISGHEARQPWKTRR